MVKIPNIKITSSRKREKCNLDFDCSTTTNFGYVQPIFAREMMPNSKFEVKTSSLVRLSAMPVPTFGRMYMKNIHVYVPYVDVCPQFDSFLTGQPYKCANQTAYYPNGLSELKSDIIAQEVLCMYADFTIYTKGNGSTADQYVPFLLDSSDATSLSAFKIAWDAVMHNMASGGTAAPNGYIFGINYTHTEYVANLQTLPGYVASRISSGQYGVCKCGDWFVMADNSVTAQGNSDFDYHSASNPTHLIGGNPAGDYVDINNADYVALFGVNANYLVAFKLKPIGKRIRTILQGLGYQFTPNFKFATGTYPNFLKLLAFYKAWFSLYRPKREYSFNSTTCYALIKELEQVSSSLYGVSGTRYWTLPILSDFIFALGTDCFAYLPQDYFGMSVETPTPLMQGNGITIDSGHAATAPNLKSPTLLGQVSQVSSGSVYINVKSATSTNFYTNPLTISLAEKVLRYANKNTVVGRSIHDYIKAHFGISLDDSHDLDSVYVIGSSSVNIQVNEVMSMAETNIPLGDYAGKAIGYGDSDKFFYENKSNTFGVWITLSVIMPKSGYYQGYLRENLNVNRYDFFTPEFDAAGYEPLLRAEVSSDYPVQTDRFNPADTNVLDLSKAFGFVPRYSHYKVGRNIVNGDLSLRSHKNSLAPYTLDRVIPYERYSDGSYGSPLKPIALLTAPSFIPNVVFDDFRRIDPQDNLGNYNRIFYYMNNDEDHFIIHNIFSVDAYLPAMSLSDSFDTKDNDGDMTEIEHS